MRYGTQNYTRSPKRSPRPRAGNPPICDLSRVGGRIVMDDVTPQKALPADSPLRGNDPKRRFFFGDPRLVSVEVVLPDLENSPLVGTRSS